MYLKSVSSNKCKPWSDSTSCRILSGSPLFAQVNLVIFNSLVCMRYQNFTVYLMSFSAHVQTICNWPVWMLDEVRILVQKPRSFGKYLASETTAQRDSCQTWKALFFFVSRPWGYKKIFMLSWAFSGNKYENANNSCHFHIYWQRNFHAQLSLAKKNFQLFVIWDLLAGQISCSAELSMRKVF